MRASICLSDLSFTWPAGDIVVAHVSADLGPGRIGIVGANGTGKSTLLGLIAGHLTPTDGSVTATGLLEYLTQDPLSSDAVTASDALDISSVVDAIRAVERGATDVDLYDRIGSEWDIEERSVALVRRLGLTVGLDQPLTELSGGELTLLSLAARLLKRPDVLLLDEPTNNLDRRARGHVIAEVNRFTGLVLIATHDRELLEHVDRIAEVRDTAVRWFTGTFDDYKRTIDEEQRAAERETRDASADLRKQQRELVATETKLARRRRYGQKMKENKREPKIVMGARKRAAQVSAGRLRGEHADHVAQARAHLSEAESRIRDDDTIQLDLPATAVPSGRVVLTMEDVELAHVGLHIDLAIHGPERVAIVGPNGAGKTTLLKTAVGELDPVGGDISLHVPVRYLPQRLDLLDPSASVIDSLASAAPSLDRTERHAALARLLFRGRQAEQLVSTLSGGELLRATLATVLHAEPAPQLLVIDEPTNHLDLTSQRQLAEALSAFQGALIVVSHDQRFLDDLGIDRMIQIG